MCSLTKVQLTITQNQHRLFNDAVVRIPVEPREIVINFSALPSKERSVMAQDNCGLNGDIRMLENSTNDDLIFWKVLTELLGNHLLGI